MKVKQFFQKLFITTFTFIFGVGTVGTIIANENVSAINGALGTQSFVKVDDPSAANEDTEYFKSEYTKLSDLIDAGAKATEEVMKEGAVLLKNDGALPLAKTAKVSPFGITSGDPIYGGTGSGSVDTSKAVNFYTAFEAAGLTLNPTLKTNYTSKDVWATKEYKRVAGSWGSTAKIGGVPWSVVSDATSSTFEEYGDAAIMVIGRVGGEGSDLKMTGAPDGYEGDYLHLSQHEMDTLKALKTLKDEKVFDKVILIINAASMVSLDFLYDEAYGVDAALWCGALGQNGASAIGKILTGEYVPSGKISDTFWMDHKLNPVNVNFGYWEYEDSDVYGIESQAGNSFVPEPTLNAYVVYQEGMYLGYRYTETRYEDKVMGKANVGDFNYSDVVAYPFGHGLSYTTFEYENFNVSKSGERTYNLSIDVTNTGNTYSGKETVQFYVSKPYGDYAKQNNIQVPSVELVEFGKTGVLAPGAKETLTVSVDEKFFTSYDAYGAGTYVIMGGDYYITAATDAHNAVNNILAAKGFGASSAMVGSGDAELVEKITLSFNDQRYAYSDATGNPITNLFDYGDINRYEGKGDNKVEYYNRDNWAGTVSLDRENGVPVLKATQKLADDILAQCPEEYNKPIPKDAEKTAYPKYGVDAGLTLVNMRYAEDGTEIAFNDTLWDTFMDQLTWDEVVLLISSGYHITEAVETIAKPGTRDENGPNGFNQKYNKGKGLYYRNEVKAGHVDSDGKLTADADPDGNKKTTAFPANGIVAATFNKELAYQAGKIIGEDGLWSGHSGLYGIGANTHRSPYLGRTVEYYSECGTLAGLMAAAETRGIEEKGVHVYNKHAVVNDQENCRHGVGVWVSEQALREIYLRAFELPITIGGGFNTMASFARIGAMSGSADGVLGQKFFRDECGMRGIIITDCYTDMDGKQGSSPYFEMAYGIYTGGCDLPDGSKEQIDRRIIELTGQTSFEKFKPDANGEGEYATMAWQMRLAAKRICYMVAHSNAMNGIASSTRIVRVNTWWQNTLLAVDAASGILMLISVAWVIGDCASKKNKKK